ncbi:metal ABC transporter substrate-binding protein [Clostridium sp. MD294]|uniref:metal ABC transporter substrate-binding protein n=1 Tax=Clostridium sp. MD294 TaxID=97138 RepID=UPI0002CBAC12|nr:metal ABC transporter substrate-binding protein [Clostridium sp. MD294]USF29751.1 High-affinity zinc uptake system binding-protein ZnuA [Clostridium sp. MD294]
MKKCSIVLLCILMLFSGCSSQKIEQQTVTVVASFYPVYVLAKNITDGVEGVTLENMAQPKTGCLHDYQLTTKDRKALEKADLFLINGAGMEAFLEGVKKQYIQLPVLDTSIGVKLLDTHHHHHHDNKQEHGEEEEVYNGHIWLYSENALKQAENICNVLCQKDSKHKQQYVKNLEVFQQKIQNFQKQQKSQKTQIKIISFHEAFDYVAEEYGFTICAEVLVEEEKTPSAKELTQVIDLVKQQNITVFFAAEDEGKKYAQLIAKETGAKVYLLNPITTGELQKDAYLKAMEQNKNVIQEAIGL